jgi:hypothetical protein
MYGDEAEERSGTHYIISAPYIPLSPNRVFEVKLGPLLGFIDSRDGGYGAVWSEHLYQLPNLEIFKVRQLNVPGYSKATKEECAVRC